MKKLIFVFTLFLISMNVHAESVIKKNAQKAECPLCIELNKVSAQFNDSNHKKALDAADDVLAPAVLSKDPKIRDQELRALFPLALKVIKIEKNSDFSDYLFAIYEDNKAAFESEFLILEKEKVLSKDDVKMIKGNIEHRRKIQAKGEEADGE